MPGTIAMEKGTTEDQEYAPQTLSTTEIKAVVKNSLTKGDQTDGRIHEHTQTFSPFCAYQKAIYLEGVTGKRPIMSTDPNLWESVAQAAMTPESFAYARGGAGLGDTVRNNFEVFRKWSIIPRMVRANVERPLGVTIFGKPWPSPVAVAPMGVNRIFHRDGEEGMARAAARAGLPYTFSTFASSTPEDVARAQDAAAPDSDYEQIRWLQLYWPQSVDQELTRSILRRAKQSGYSALIITLDIFSMSWRPADLDNAYLPLYLGLSTALGFSDPVFRRKYRERHGKIPEADMLAGALEWEETIFPGVAHDWPELRFLRNEWDGPIVVKGIQSAVDAELAVQAGVDGIIVSNHGGRQYDGAPAALDALQDIVEAVGTRVEVMFDSGIRCGADIMKALALGAKAVFVGRPIVYGLGARGEAGAEHVMKCLLADLEINLAITGARGIIDLRPSSLQRSIP